MKKQNTSIHYVKYYCTMLLVVITNLLTYATTYYVSPTGNDNNPGTETQPWQTLNKTSITLMAGDSAIFEDGIYPSGRVNFFTAGTINNTIVLKARNKYGAILEFDNTATVSLMLYRPYIVIEDFEILKSIPGNHDGYQLVTLNPGADFCMIIGNRISNVYGRAISANQVKGIIIENNTVSKIDRTGINFFGVDSSIIRNNSIDTIGGNGIIIQAGSKSIAVYNNDLTIERPAVYGILLGGLTNTSTGLVEDFSMNGYECFNCVAYNNKINVLNYGDLNYGYAIQSGRDCAFFNNIVSGAKYGLATLFSGQHIANGWDWNPTNDNSSFKNNIITNTTMAAVDYKGLSGTSNMDYNLYFHSQNTPDEPNSVYFDPCFIAAPTDCHLNQNSRGVNTGTVCTFTGFDGETMDVSKDKDGVTRTVPWDMGIYDIIATPMGDGVCNPTTYYLSPTGSDDNPGTEMMPWKTLFKASITMAAGDSLIIEDGEYIETLVTSFTVNPGTKDHPIIITARNKHQAKIIYSGLSGDAMVIQQPYIILQNLDISKAVQGTTTADVIIFVQEGGDFCTIRCNKIHNAYEEGIKSFRTKGLVIEKNILYDFVHEGIDFVAVDSSIIRENEIYAVQRIGILAGKGGSKSIQVYNNYIHINTPMCCGGYGIILGGSSSKDAVENTSITGYEAWNIVAYNNLIISEMPGAILSGLSIVGGKDCAFYNNTIVGARIGLQTITAIEDIENGWDWAPTNDNPIFKNNIIVNSTINAVSFPPTTITGTPELDYNLYYNNPNEPLEPNSVYANPKFIIINNDWYLQEDSPAINGGTSWVFTGKFGETIIGNKDIEGVPRATPWDIGAYEVDYGNLCIDTDKLFMDTLKNRVYQYQNTIETSLTLANNANITLKAGQSITLKTGFYAKIGINFTARIEGCSIASILAETPIEERNTKPSNIKKLTDIAFKIFPNPIQKGRDLSISIKGAIASTTNLSLYAITGQLIQTFPFVKNSNSQISLNTDKLIKGMYFLVLQNQHQIISQKVIILEK